MSLMLETGKGFRRAAGRWREAPSRRMYSGTSSSLQIKCGNSLKISGLQSRLLRGPQKDFADKALRRLGDDGFDRVRNIVRLQHFRRIFSGVR